MRRTEVLMPLDNQDVQVLGELDANLSSEYFGSFNLIFENTSDKWLTLRSFDVSFRNDSANKYIDVVKGDQLVTWSKVVAKQNRLESNGFDKIEESIFNFGSDVTGISRILGPATDVLGIKKPQTKQTSVYPENHVYAEDIVIPPGMLVEKWILFNSSNHRHIKYLNEIYIDFVTNDTEYDTRLKFRKPKKKGHFSWSSDDPNTWRLQVEPYLIMNRTDIEQTLGFSDLSVKSDFNFPLENPELGLHAEVYNQKLAFVFDIFSINASDDVPIPGELLQDASGRFDFDIFSSELLFAYKFLPINKLQLEMMTGARYRKIRFDSEIVSEIGALQGDWVDLVLGSRLRYNISTGLYLTARTDIGGLGGSANYTWNSTFGVGYSVTRKTDLTIKLNPTKIKFEEEKNTEDAFIYNGSELRILVGAAIKF